MDGDGGQHRLYIVIYSVQKKKLAVSEGGSLMRKFTLYQGFTICICSNAFFFTRNSMEKYHG